MRLCIMKYNEFRLKVGPLHSFTLVQEVEIILINKGDFWENAKTFYATSAHLWKNFGKPLCNLQYLYRVFVTKNGGPKMCDLLAWTQLQQKSPKKVCREKNVRYF